MESAQGSNDFIPRNKIWVDKEQKQWLMLLEQCMVREYSANLYQENIMPHKGEKRPVPEDIIGCQAAAFEWAESYDSKDWDRLSKCLAPTLYIDYRTVMGMIWEKMPAAEFLSMASSPRFLGNARIKTQHLMGQAKWVQTEPSEIKGYHQMRVAHQKYRDDELSQVLYTGHAHGKAKVHYRLVENEWKFAGIEPDIRWSEGDYDKIFHED